MKQKLVCRKFTDCFANRNGKCYALNSTSFKKKCPFYKKRGASNDNGILASELNWEEVNE